MTLREDVLQKKPMEIERQFLIDTLPTLPAEYDTIRQGYVALLPEIRIRQINDSGFP